VENPVKIQKLLDADNIAEILDDGDLQEIGMDAAKDYEDDEASRDEWRRNAMDAMDVAMQVAQEKSFPWPNACYSLDTDILTADGWVPVGDVKVGDLVASRTPEGEVVYVPATQTFRHTAPTTIGFHGKHIDLVVTPNHRMYVETPAGQVKFVDAQEAFDNNPAVKIPLTGQFTGDDEEVEELYGLPAKAAARFLGWYISEGHSYTGRAVRTTASGEVRDYGKSYSSVGISQSKTANPHKYEILRQDIEACGFSYSERDTGFIVHARTMPLAFKQALRDMGTHLTKHIPDAFLRASVETQQELLETLVLGDGNIKIRSGRLPSVTYYTTAERLAGQIQILALNIGKNASVRERQPVPGGYIGGRQIKGVHTGYSVSIRDKRKVQLYKTAKRLYSTPTEVACVEAGPHNVLYVRRNGKALWCGNSNIRWPGLTIASLQFNARAYPALVPGHDLVKCYVLGPDPAGEEQARAMRIARHMSYQLLEKDAQWEEDFDRLLIMLPIIGVLFKKTYFDPLKETCRSELVTPFDLVVPYFAKTLEDAARITHVIEMLQNGVEERIRGGIYRDVELPPVQIDQTALEQQVKENRGLVPPASTKGAPRKILEQHCTLDLDGDGYEEPYIVTVDKQSKEVLRIIKRYGKDDIKTDRDEEIKMVAQAAMNQVQQLQDNFGAAELIMDEAEREIEKLRNRAEIIRIEPIHYFTKFGFIPAPDGSFYDVGFGTLQKPIIEAINTMLNQLIDSGTLQNSATGFVSRSARLKKGDMRFRPFEWKQVDVVGGNLRDSIVPLPVQEPSAVLFNSLSLLINYSERLFSVSELMTGQTPGQNTPATTSMAALEQGMAVYSGIFKRLYRALKNEYKKVYRLNREYLDPIEYFLVVGTNEQSEVYAEDYKRDANIIPSADPNTASEQQRQQKAEMIAARAYSVPGYNTAEAERRLLEAYRVPGTDTLYPLDENGQPAIQPPPNPEIELAKAEEQRRAEDQQGKLQIAVAKLEMDAAKLGAEIAKLEADTVLAMAKAQSEVQGMNLEQANLRLKEMGERRESLLAIIEAAKVMEGDSETETRGSESMAG
jgi:chaperonin GroES